MRVPRMNLLVATLTLAVAAPSVANDKVAVKAGMVHTLTGDPIENGVVVIEGGRITAVGAPDQVQIPWDAVVLDLSLIHI